MKKLAILGIRGIPAAHGGFETFAEKFALYLVGKGWDVTVFCQEDAADYPSTQESEWQGVRRVHIPVRGNGALATIIFDWKVAWLCKDRQTTLLTLGYNTAVFNAINWFRRQVNVMNMDGLEWKRKKWKLHQKIWLFLNERAGIKLTTHLIADHPLIAEHLARSGAKPRDVSMIPYGAEKVISDDVDKGLLAQFGLEENHYAVLIARPEPENSILEIVRAFSQTKHSRKLVVLGNFDTENNEYHRAVVDAASHEVVFLGAIYDSRVVKTLRYYSRFYCHGHRVGGTNPSLVEALGSGSPVLAHDNGFNRWVAADAACYFSDEASCADEIVQLFSDDALYQRLTDNAVKIHSEKFYWEKILNQYESVLTEVAYSQGKKN